MLTVGFLSISGGLVASVVSMLVRAAGAAAGEQRQQLRLIALSAALIAVGIVCLFVVQAVNGGEQTWLAGAPAVRRLLPAADPVRRRRCCATGSTSST